MSIQSIDEVEDSICQGIRQLRKWGFRIVRDVIPGDDDNMRQQDALLAACAFLGLESTAENKKSTHVNNLARALLNNNS
jgi:hypothetical protein